MRVVESERRIELTRSNLVALLTKLDGHPSDSYCTIAKDGWAVTAVENSAHYSDRPRGRMVAETEAAMQQDPRSRPRRVD